VNISKRKVEFIACTLIVLAGLAFLWIQLHRHAAMRREREEAIMEVERVEQMRIAGAYVRLHYSFLMSPDPEGHHYDVYRRHGVFRNFRTDFPGDEPHVGINNDGYLILRMYYHRTGIVLAYETVVDYFSQEFEPDGSLRLYNNGNHPEIEAFVNWAWNGRLRQEMSDFINALELKYSLYFRTHASDGFVRQNFGRLSPQMLDALARAEADPDYVLDLTSLQQQGY